MAATLVAMLSLAACTNERRPLPAASNIVAFGLSRLELPEEAAQPALVVVLRERGGDAGLEAEGTHDAARRQDAKIGLRWDWEPKELQVYRSTAVHFRLDAAPAGHDTAACEWNFGDGTPMEHGCNVSHTFHGGLADQVVTLHLSDGSWEWKSVRTIPLETLGVYKELVDDQVSTNELPPPPKSKPGAFRFAVIADSAAAGGVPEDVRSAVRALAGTVRPELVIHVGGIVPSGGGDPAWDLAKDAIGTPLTEAGIKLAWAMAPADRAEGSRVRRPDLQMIDGARYPERYSFTYKGSFFLVFGSSHDSGVSEDTIKWMRGELAKARVYEARYVVTYLPLVKFGDEHVGSLDKKFRLYELFLRARVTTLFSAAYRVYFKGRYGVLPVVSVGALAAPGGKLAGHDFEQPPSFVVVDVVKNVPERMLAVEGPDFLRPLDESLLPDAVEVYTR